MNPAEIPVLKLLLHLFKRLRRYGFPLGIEDYMLALQALQGGFGIGDRKALERLCCTLWAKSEEETRQIHRLLNEMLEKPDIYRKPPPYSKSPQPVSETSNPPPSQTSSAKPEEPVVSSTPQPVHKTSASSTSPPSSPESEEPTSEPSSPADLFPDTEPEQVIQAIRSSQPDSLEMSYSPESEDRYLPVTSRQMKQSWRFLRRPVREGKLEELDVPGTVDKICREGILLEPVLTQRYSNRAEVVLLVDQGAPSPCNSTCRQLVSSRPLFWRSALCTKLSTITNTSEQETTGF